ncbi:MAG TPA: carbon-nitrogen hydrolase family protein [Anaerolineae bacterium]|nr:carbon-nitrogen hydrolase family protein [Anaerolineae bacterium]HOQ98854.1 carbon-nitrogen hydrolase family protein [Anaerolineae bacterium]HPL27078.1 carbon-nitrogen hydrolase family protein [Anaerolineae bacterium]
MREITVAVAQMAPLLTKVPDNLKRMGEMVEEICRAQKVDVIVFPELATTGYECGVQFTDLAERVPGASVNYLAQRAADYEVYVAFGMVEKTKVESTLYDTAVLIDPSGEVAASYHKIHLKGEERLAFRPGFKNMVVETKYGQIGLLLGWDLAFPEAARCLTLQGMELLCVCANWESPHSAEWRAYLAARAFENAVFVAAANRLGEDYTISFFGDSQIIGPRGEVYASFEENVEGYRVAKIDLDEVKKYREELQILQCRHPQAYREIVRMY